MHVECPIFYSHESVTMRRWCFFVAALSLARYLPGRAAGSDSFACIDDETFTFRNKENACKTWVAKKKTAARCKMVSDER